VRAEAALVLSGDVDYLRLKHAADFYRRGEVSRLVLMALGLRASRRVMPEVEWLPALVPDAGPAARVCRNGWPSGPSCWGTPCAGGLLMCGMAGQLFFEGSAPPEGLLGPGRVKTFTVGGAAPDTAPRYALCAALLATVALWLAARSLRPRPARARRLGRGPARAAPAPGRYGRQRLRLVWSAKPRCSWPS
jgi:hypothetical protein